MSVNINNNDINKAREIIYKIAGIYLPTSKDSTIKNRLDMLKRKFNIQDFDNFFHQVKHGHFKQEFVNAFTTNKTDFFREGFHFDDMLDRILPHRLKENEPIKVYCSASSTGEEPYSIATTLLYAKEIYCSSTPVSVLATDIDTSVLAKNLLNISVGVINYLIMHQEVSYVLSAVRAQYEQLYSLASDYEFF